MYITYLNSTHAQPLRALVHCISSRTNFVVITVRSLVQHPFPLRDRRTARRCPYGGWGWGMGGGGICTPYISAQCLRGTVRGTVGEHCHARALHSAAHDACTAVAQYCPSQVPRKHPFSHFPERGVHSVRHSVPPHGGNDIGNGHMPAPCCAQCSAQCPAPGVSHLLSFGDDTTKIDYA